MHYLCLLVVVFLLASGCTQEYRVIQEVGIYPTYRNEMPTIRREVLYEVDTIVIDSMSYYEINSKKNGQSSTIELDKSRWPKPLIQSNTILKYPEIARHTGKEGSVVCEYLIKLGGRTTRCNIRRSDSHLFNDAARLYFIKQVYEVFPPKKAKQYSVLGVARITFKLKPQPKK